MYNLNTLQRNVLITPKEVIFHAQTKHALDENMIEKSIIVAEERFIREELGYELYEAMINAKNVEVISGNLAALNTSFGDDSIDLKIGDIVNAYELMSASYQSLWKQHLWKIVSECVMVAAYPEGFVQYGSEGTFHNSPPAGLMVTSGFVTPLLSSMKWAIDKKIRDRIGPLLNSMHKYLCKNKINYSLYNNGDCLDCEDAKDKLKDAGFALDIYSDIDDERELH